MKYIIGNWKMNPKKLEDAKSLVSDIRKVSKAAVLGGVQPIICPPNIYLSSLINKSDTKLSFGSQDVWVNNTGMETGQTSSLQYKNLGIKYSIIGHSECRKRGDDNKLISEKLINSVKTGVTAILCVGEIERDNGGEYFKYVANQIRECLDEFPQGKLSNLLITYEPVWAIGENAIHPASPRDFQEMAMLIRRTLSELFPKDKAFNIPLLYGGSVDKKNAQSFIDVGADGLLIGRISLKSKEFISIIDNAVKSQANNKK